MNDLPDFPRATHVWIEFLKGKFPAVRVSNQLLGDVKFIRIRRVGGTERDLVTDHPTMAIEAYDRNADLAEQFATQIRGVIRRHSRSVLVPGVACKGITEYSGPYEDPDENHDSFRFSWTFGSALRVIEKEIQP